MPITDHTDYRWLESQIEEHIARVEQAIIRTLKYCGEEAVNTARSKVLLIPSRKAYKNQTGNLASSIGYVISVDGKIEQESSFEVVKGGTEGAAEGRAFARDLVRDFPKGIALIVVAGKEYAWHLQNRGYDVVDSAELHTERIAQELLSDLKLDKQTL